jgi:hypothetical protein
MFQSSFVIIFKNNQSMAEEETDSIFQAHVTQILRKKMGQCEFVKRSETTGVT